MTKTVAQRSVKMANLVLLVGILSFCSSLAYAYRIHTQIRGEAAMATVPAQVDISSTDQMRQSALQAYNKDPRDNTYSYETDQIPMPLVGH